MTFNQSIEAIFNLKFLESIRISFDFKTSNKEEKFVFGDVFIDMRKAQFDFGDVFKDMKVAVK